MIHVSLLFLVAFSGIIEGTLIYDDDDLIYDYDGDLNYDDVENIPENTLPHDHPQIQDGQYNEHCLTGRMCDFNFGNCSLANELCPNPVCKCANGYAWSYLHDSCRRFVDLGERCNAVSDECAAEDSECLQNRCRCAPGYKLGPSGRNCVSVLKTEYHDSVCYDSVQCYGNAICLCIESSCLCQCYTGYKPSNNYTCVERTLGDVCTADDDCSKSPNTICRRSQCICQADYKPVKFKVSASETRTGCIPKGEKLVGKGGVCSSKVSDTLGISSNLCELPFVCIECDSVISICARV